MKKNPSEVPAPHTCQTLEEVPVPHTCQMLEIGYTVTSYFAVNPLNKSLLSDQNSNPAEADDVSLCSPSIKF